MVSKNLIVKDKCQQGNRLTGQFRMPDTDDNESAVSEEYCIGGLVLFQFNVKKCILKRVNAIQLLLQIKNCQADDTATYTVKFSSPEMGIENKTCCYNNSDKAIYEYLTLNYFSIEVVIDIVVSPSFFKSLYEDTELTDFQLRGVDGSVAVHKLILAASSPVWKRMLCGKWKETIEGVMEVAGTSKHTLEHLREYLYLHTLPDTEADLTALWMIAKYYEIHDLLDVSTVNLLFRVTHDNFSRLLDFAMKFKFKKLYFGILAIVKYNDHLLTEILKLDIWNEPEAEAEIKNSKSITD